MTDMQKFSTGAALGAVAVVVFGLLMAMMYDLGRRSVWKDGIREGHAVYQRGLGFGWKD